VDCNGAVYVFGCLLNASPRLASYFPMSLPCPTFELSMSCGEFQNLAMVAVFTAGYMGIVFEEFLAFNKSGVALLMAVSLWVILSLGVKPSKLLLSPSLFSFQAFQKFSRKCRVSRKSAC
jgi:hypothetical protein